ncbi:transcriptional regulator family: Fungal Specific TF [Paecilomyces variotii]|nr:transcriptional regulator family: Fungal Specific TF [Paecilomyces variotii]
MCDRDRGIGQTRRRTRTGCLRCRARKRKCDEERPVCHSCRSRNLECVYGTRLSFLSKNAHTLDQSTAAHEGDNHRYNSVQFVAEIPPDRPQNANIHGENISPFVKSCSQAQNAESIGLSGENTISQTGFTSHLHPATGQEIRDVGLNVRSSLDPRHLLRNPSGLSSRSSFGEHYEESAVHDLLALGHSTMETHPTENINLSVSVQQTSCLSLNPTAAACMSSAVSSGNLVSAQDTNSEQVLELLKHFRYEIAPWLDIYDMSHSFGILVSRMAMASRELLYALLAVSVKSLASLDSSPSTFRSDANKYVDISESYRNIEKATNNLHRTVAAVLRVVYHLSSRLSDTRMKIAKEIESVVTVSTNPWEPVLMAAVYGLLLRIDISSALTNNTTLRVPIPANVHAPAAAMQSHLDVVFRHSQYILILCAQAVQLQSATLETESPLQPTGPEKFVERWKMLVASLGDWYKNRPQGFWPMLELSSTPEMAETVNPFPMILFTNSAAVFANQMLHTAMCLLLDRRPRTLKSMDNHNVMMSPLWNAHRICGIALNNDRRECWDPSLVASLFVAARKMTHESQQKEIEKGFLRIQELTGWDMHDPLAKLHETWRLADGN